MTWSVNNRQTISSQQVNFEWLWLASSTTFATQSIAVRTDDIPKFYEEDFQQYLRY